MSERLILHTKEPMRCDWPKDTFVQGGGSGIVFRRDGEPSYRTAFVEVSPPKNADGLGTFLRGEGATIAEAEAQAWVKFQRWQMCVDGVAHGPYERRNYKNGAAFCIACGTWFSHVFEPIPETPEEQKAAMGPLGRLLRALAEEAS